MSDITAEPKRNHVAGDRTMMALEQESDRASRVQRKKHPLDEEMPVALQRSLRGHYLRELDLQRVSRREMARDEDIYDGIDHWDPVDAATVRARGQVPLVFNVTFNAVNWLLGSQRANPVDYSILPRTERGKEHAEQKTQLMKYLRDIGDSRMMESRIFKEQVCAGLSWFETGGRNEDEGEPVYERMESWRNIIHDTAAQEPDLSDARYIFRSKWLDADRAASMFPDRVVTILQSCDDVLGMIGRDEDSMGDSAMDSWEAGTTNSQSLLHLGRKRLRVVETWYKRPMKFDVVRGGEFSGEIYDGTSERHQWAEQQPNTSVVAVVKERMMVAIWCEAGMLWSGPSPYRHNSFPFTPVWGYRRARDGYAYGMIRQARDIQIDLNKRASKALWHITAKRAFVEAGAVLDLDVFREELHRPDAVFVYNKGFAPPVIEHDLQHASAQTLMMDRNISMIEQISGVTSENRGIGTGDQSGKAILAKQDQGQLASNSFFENFRFARRIHGGKMLSNIEQFYTAEKIFRITNERGRPEYVGINTTDPSKDDYIANSRADFIVSEEDYRASHRQQNVEKLMELVTMLASASPEAVMAILDLLIEALDVPKGGEIVKRIRQAGGIPDPDADPTNPDPETEAMMAQKAAQQEKADRAAEAEIQGLEAKAKHTAAQALKLTKEAEGLDLKREDDEIARFGNALNVAAQVVGYPELGRAADAIMDQARSLVAAAAALKGGAMAPPTLEPVAALAPPMPKPEGEGQPPGNAPKTQGTPVNA